MYIFFLSPVQLKCGAFISEEKLKSQIGLSMSSQYKGKVGLGLGTVVGRDMTNGPPFKPCIGTLIAGS